MSAAFALVIMHTFLQHCLDDGNGGDFTGIQDTGDDADATGQALFHDPHLAWRFRDRVLGTNQGASAAGMADLREHHDGIQDGTARPFDGISAT